ncbi:hypothetical protein PPHE_a3719 [Pseudoalteromonas phenolica O-BC30]|nr:hypothetical protein [Pseudoalteromonas phenolica O-BC30]
MPYQVKCIPKKINALSAKYTLRSKVIFAQGEMSNINGCNGVLNLSFLRHL